MNRDALLIQVAPLAGAWIETKTLTPKYPPTYVAPLAGAWIETRTHRYKHQNKKVAPLAGAWIETCAPPLIYC